MITKLNHGIPVFGKLERVLVIDGAVVVLQYNTLSIVEYVSHLNAYRVKLCNDTNYIKQEELIDFHPLGIHSGFGCFKNHLLVVLKYRVDIPN